MNNNKHNENAHRDNGAIKSACSGKSLTENAGLRVFTKRNLQTYDPNTGKRSRLTPSDVSLQCTYEDMLRDLKKYWQLSNQQTGSLTPSNVSLQCTYEDMLKELRRHWQLGDRVMDQQNLTQLSAVVLRNIGKGALKEPKRPRLGNLPPKTRVSVIHKQQSVPQQISVGAQVVTLHVPDYTIQNYGELQLARQGALKELRQRGASGAVLKEVKHRQQTATVEIELKHQRHSASVVEEPRLKQVTTVLMQALKHAQTNSTMLKELKHRQSNAAVILEVKHRQHNAAVITEMKHRHATSSMMRELKHTQACSAMLKELKHRQLNAAVILEMKHRQHNAAVITEMKHRLATRTVLRELKHRQQNGAVLQEIKCRLANAAVLNELKYVRFDDVKTPTKPSQQELFRDYVMSKLLGSIRKVLYECADDLLRRELAELPQHKYDERQLYQRTLHVRAALRDCVDYAVNALVDTQASEELFGTIMGLRTGIRGLLNAPEMPAMAQQGVGFSAQQAQQRPGTRIELAQVVSSRSYALASTLR